MHRGLPILVGITLFLPMLAAAEEQQDLFVPWKVYKQEAYSDTDSLAWKHAGIRFGDFVGVEGHQYVLNYSDYLRYSPLENNTVLKQENMQALKFLGVGKVPLSDEFALFAKAGPSYLQPVNSQNLSTGLPGFSMSDWGLSYSTGASVHLSPNIEFSLEYGHTEINQIEVASSIAQLKWNFK